MKQIFNDLIRAYLLMILSKCRYFTLQKEQSILILAPHPDDETFGLGGTILQTILQGGHVSVVFLTDGENTGTWNIEEEIRRQRIALSEAAMETAGVSKDNIYRLHLTDGSLPMPAQKGNEWLVAQIALLIDQIKPDLVFATSDMDFWPFDHVACAHAARQAIIQASHNPKLFYYWVWTWYNFRPWKKNNLRKRLIYKVGISEVFQKKASMANLYLQSLTPNKKPWSGILPPSLIKALQGKFEVIEEIPY